MTVGKIPFAGSSGLQRPTPTPATTSFRLAKGGLRERGFLATHPLLCWGGLWETPTLATTSARWRGVLWESHATHPNTGGDGRGVSPRSTQHKRRWVARPTPAGWGVGQWRTLPLPAKGIAREGDCPHSHPLLFFYLFFGIADMAKMHTWQRLIGLMWIFLVQVANGPESRWMEWLIL